MTHRFLTIVLLLLDLVDGGTAVAQTEVSDFRPGTTLDGVCYFLPKTVFEVILVAEKAVTKPGEFAAYSDRYLRQPNVPTFESTTWTLKSISLMPYGVPDSTKAYSVKLKSRTSAPFVSLTEDGLLLSINTNPEEYVLPELPKKVAAPKPINGRDFMTREILSAGSTAKMAQLTAEEIYEIRESRNALIRGEADNMPKDGAQLKLMLDNLDQQLYALESLFKGETLTSTEVLTFDYEPSALEEDRGERKILCRFSKRLGLVAEDDLSGEPIWITITPTGNIPQATDNPEANRKKQKMEQGVWVNVPATARITISTAEQTLLTTDFPICQLGTTEVLSDVLFNRHTDTHVLIHQHTGNVKRLWQE